MAEKKVVDWESIEKDFRAGLLSQREIAGQYGVSHAAIQKRAKRDGWDRDLNAKIKAKLVLPAAEEPPRAGFVYVIYLDDSADIRYFKIGMARSFTARFDQHQCSSPFDVCVACAYFVSDMRAEERALHALYADQRVRGEWFRLSGADLLSIAQRAILV